MDLRNCKKCNRMFKYVGNPLCSRCVEERETDYQKVKHYLREKPGSSISEVEEETGVDSQQILQFLRDDRLEIKNEDEYILDCESCGKKIPSGRFCKSCMSSLERDIKSVTKVKEVEKSKKQRDGDKFRIVNRYKD